MMPIIMKKNVAPPNINVKTQSPLLNMRTKNRRKYSPKATNSSDITVYPDRSSTVRCSPFFSHAALNFPVWLEAACSGSYVRDASAERRGSLSFDWGPFPIAVSPLVDATTQWPTDDERRSERMTGTTEVSLNRTPQKSGGLNGSTQHS